MMIVKPNLKDSPITCQAEMPKKSHRKWRDWVLGLFSLRAVGTTLTLECKQKLLQNLLLTPLVLCNRLHAASSKTRFANHT